MNILEKRHPSVDGKNTLYGKIYIPDGEIKGTVQIVHGMTEHIDRYEPLMRALADNGYVAFGHNHIGHKNSSPDDELGHFGYSDGFRHLINDTNAFGDAVCADYPDKKRFIFGHSMGSFVVRLAILREPERFSGVIVCGTGGPNKLSGLGLMFCNLVTLIKGGKHVSKTVYGLAFSKYNERFASENNPRSWITTDSDIRDKYAADRYCNFKFSVCGMHDLIKLQHLCNKPIWAEAVEKTLPIYLVSGDNDPVGDYGEGVKTVYNRLVKAGCDVKMKLYNGARHEILNDFTRNEAITDILAFIEKETNK